MLLFQFAIKNRKLKPKDGYWLEAAAKKYDKQFISDLQVYKYFPVPLSEQFQCSKYSKLFNKNIFQFLYLNRLSVPGIPNCSTKIYSHSSI